MFYLDYAKPVGDRYILNFFADTIEDLKDVPATTPFISRNGTNYGVPLDTSVVTVVENGVKVNYVLQQGKYIVGGDIAPFNIAYSETAPTDTSKLWIKTEEPEDIEFVRNTAYITHNNYEESVELPIPEIYMASGAVCDEHLYIFGGNKGGDNSDTIIEYNIVDHNISILSAKLPVPSFGIGCAAVGTKVYLFGGATHEDGIYNSVTGIDTIQEFDAVTKTITTLPITLQKPAAYNTVVAAGTKIYIFGGCNTNDGSATEFFNTIQEFDTVARTITTLPVALDAPIAYAIAGLINSKIYLLSGLTNYGNFSRKIQVFDVAAKGVTLLPQTSMDIFTGCYGVIGTKIVFATGNRADGLDYGIYEFDTITLETKAIGEYFDSDEEVGGAVYKNTLYGFGGWSITTNRIVEFTFTFPLSSNNILIQETLDKNLFDLTPAPARVQIGAQNVWKGNENNEAEFVDAYLHNGTNWVNVNTEEVLVE